MRKILCVTLGLFFASTIAAQQFELIDGNGTLVSTILLERNRMMVELPNGNRQIYEREQRYDSANLKYLGYVDARSKRVIRFPASGTGPLQWADLTAVQPKFQSTTSRVRPLPNSPGLPPRSRHVQIPWTPGSVPIIPHNPALYPYPLYHSPYATYGFGRFPFPRSFLVDTRIVPDPPLSPVEVKLRNGGTRDIQVDLIDLKQPNRTQSMRIKPQTHAAIRLQRDSHATQIDTYQSVSYFGELQTHVRERRIIPPIRYEVEVREWTLQSIAVDRTGKSPNPIEDVNYQGRGLGKFALPPGESLASGTIDAYANAVNSNNPGLVTPIVAAEKQSSTKSALEQVLEAQRAAQQR